MVWFCKGNYIMILINLNRTDLLLTHKIISFRESSMKLWFLFYYFCFIFFLWVRHPYALYAVEQFQEIKLQSSVGKVGTSYCIRWDHRSERWTFELLSPTLCLLNVYPMPVLCSPPDLNEFYFPTIQSLIQQVRFFSELFISWCVMRKFDLLFLGSGLSYALPVIRAK